MKPQLDLPPHVVSPWHAYRLVKILCSEARIALYYIYPAGLIISFRKAVVVLFLKSLSSAPNGHASGEAAPVKCHWMNHEKKTVINCKDFKIRKLI